MAASGSKKSFFEDVFNKKISFSFGRKKKIKNGKLVDSKEKGLVPLERNVQRFFSHHGLLVIILILPLMLVTAAFYLYDTKYQDRVFNGISVLGIDAGGKTKAELRKDLDKKVLGYKLKLEGGNQVFEVGLKSLGITYDTVTMTDKAFSFGRDGSVLENYYGRARGLLAGYDFDLGIAKVNAEGSLVKSIYTIDNKKLEKFLAKVEKKINVTPKDSSITTEGASIKVLPAVFGRKLKTEVLKEKIIAASTSFQPAPLAIQTETWSPKIADEKARALAEEADNLASKQVVLSYKGKSYFPTKDVVVSWITFTRSGNKSDWKMVIDAGRMYSYFDTLGSSGINVLPVDQQVRVENGVKEKILKKGKNGLIINKALLSSEISNALQNNPEVKIAIPMMIAYYQTYKDYVIVANWAKYIEVNISTQTMIAYEKGGKKVGTWSITSGQNNVIEGYNTNTPTGTFLIRGKANDICMPNPPGDGKLCHIHYVSYFTDQGHAIHEAWWRSYFGGQDYVWNGSHGCINAPLSVAQFIYGWAPIGTPVMIHY